MTVQLLDAVARLPKNVLIGRSCNNSFRAGRTEQLQMAQTMWHFGAIFATDTKPEAGNIGLETLKQAKAKTKCTYLCNWRFNRRKFRRNVIEAGADFCAVISDVLGRSMSDVSSVYMNGLSFFAEVSLNLVFFRFQLSREFS